MAKRTSMKKDDYYCNNWSHRGHAGNGAYGLGVVGALVYYIQHATSFVAGVIGVLKALVWPAMVVYELLKFLKM